MGGRGITERPCAYPVEVQCQGEFHSQRGQGESSTTGIVKGCVYSAWSQKASNYIRACSPTDTSVKPQTLESVNTTSELVFRTNHRLVVLNDTVNGNVWNPEDSTKVIKIQWNKIQTEQTEKEQQNNDSANNHHDFSKTGSAQSGQIKAEDDEIGARAGSEQILDVLRNDEQTDCSVLKITKVGAPNNKDVTISPIYDGRYLQLDASAASAGTVTFTYDISDGRGQTSSATVTVTLNDGGNHAPVQFDTPPEIDVEQGASYTANALSSFNDPDGDPLTLVSAGPRTPTRCRCPPEPTASLRSTPVRWRRDVWASRSPSPTARQPAPAWCISRSNPRTPWPRSSTR